MRGSMKALYYTTVSVVALFLAYLCVNYFSPTTKTTRYLQEDDDIRNFLKSPQQQTLRTDSDPSNRKSLLLEVYMESQCSDTFDFMHEQLWPAWANIQPYVDLKIYPYGKVKETVIHDDHGQDYSFQCQHGPSECLVNQLMCCVINRLDYDPLLYLPVILCLQNSPASNLRQCILKSERTLNHDDIQKCGTGREGRSLHHVMGVATNKLEPALYFVPWVVVNGKREAETLDDLTQVICNKYKGPKKLPFCSHA